MGGARAGCADLRGSSLANVKVRSAALSAIVGPALVVGLAGCSQSMFTSREPIVYLSCEIADYQASVWRKLGLDAQRKGDDKNEGQATWVQSRIIVGSPTCFSPEAVDTAVQRLTEEPPGG